MYILYTQYTYAQCNIKHTKTGYIQSTKYKVKGKWQCGFFSRLIDKNH